MQEEGTTGGLGLALTNFTGSSFRAIYLSPGDSTGWEENVLGGAQISDGATVDIRFNSEERAIHWDLRVESIDGYYAEWKRLDLQGITSIRLILGFNGDKVVVAEVD